MRYIVSDKEHGMSLVSFLHQKGQGAYSLKKIKEAIAKKACRIGDRIEIFCSYKVSCGENINFDPTSLEKVADPLQILYEDEYFVIVNKQVGSICKDPFCENASWKLVHRLDKETSGALLLAKTAKAQKEAEKLFADRAVDKLYLAICDIRCRFDEGTIQNKLSPKGTYQGQTFYESSTHGGIAITKWKLLTKGKNTSLILCSPKTGRTHQIRIHMSEMGHPILGDVQYARKGFVSPYIARRHLLHAWKLSFEHPFTHKLVSVIAPQPEDFQSALDTLFPDYILEDV
jgi:23S rRNA-/tRNA-specific pseudouridylate synthase